MRLGRPLPIMRVRQVEIEALVEAADARARIDAAVIGARGRLAEGAAGESNGGVEPERMPEIGRANGCTPVTNAQHICRHLLEKQKTPIHKEKHVHSKHTKT